jgi:hypothetical protein
VFRCVGLNDLHEGIAAPPRERGGVGGGVAGRANLSPNPSPLAERGNRTNKLGLTPKYQAEWVDFQELARPLPQAVLTLGSKR